MGEDIEAIDFGKTWALRRIEKPFYLATDLLYTSPNPYIYPTTDMIKDVCHNFVP